MQRKYILFFAVALSIIVLDQWTKFVVVRELTTQFQGKETLGDQLDAMFSKPPEPAFRDGYHYRPRRSVTVSENFLRMRYAENPGAAWGLFRDLPENVRGPFFHLVSVAAVIFILSFFRKLSGTDRSERWALWGLPLVLGGALGNYIDRIARGFVIDFIEAHWMDKASWPSFNVADMAICVGIGMLLVDAFVRREEGTASSRSKAEASTAADGGAQKGSESPGPTRS